MNQHRPRERSQQSARAAKPYNRSFDTDVLSAGFAGLLAAGQLRR
jgi:hypothetical protein